MQVGVPFAAGAITVDTVIGFCILAAVVVGFVLARRKHRGSTSAAAAADANSLAGATAQGGGVQLVIQLCSHGQGEVVSSSRINELPDELLPLLSNPTVRQAFAELSSSQGHSDDLSERLPVAIPARGSVT